ncbi:MAG: RsmD family RNA methyltransferase [Methanoregula sp.]|jgi:tRNA (guanine37-N1)-methyltransferase|uniref:class I SAM-dependent methyltransferase n=1 Tax=Methanoregula sp. TaxID=2052170 RepID=UPI003C2721A8
MGLKERLFGIIPEEDRRRISPHFDVIGDIAIIALPENLKGYAPVIVDTIKSYRHGIRTVLGKVENVSGDCRTARYEIITGDTTVTTHHEYGFSYRLDLSTVFFNPRLASERRRVTSQVQAGESVLVPFCGAGPFVIPAAARGASVVAVEKNPCAYRWLLENLQVNRCNGRVTAVCGDASDTALLPPQPFDRAIIPTPYGMDAILGILAPCVRPAGMLHFYTFKNRKQSEELEQTLTRAGYHVTTRRRCGNVAPSVSRWVFDLRKAGHPDRNTEISGNPG